MVHDYAGSDDCIRHTFAVSLLGARARRAEVHREVDKGMVPAVLPLLSAHCMNGMTCVHPSPILTSSPHPIPLPGVLLFAFRDPDNMTSPPPPLALKGS